MFSTIVTDNFGATAHVYPERMHKSLEEAQTVAKEVAGRRKRVQVAILENHIPIDYVQSEEQ